MPPLDEISIGRGIKLRKLSGNRFAIDQWDVGDSRTHCIILTDNQLATLVARFHEMRKDPLNPPVPILP